MSGEWVEIKGVEHLAQVFGSGFQEIRPGLYQGRCPAEASHTKGGSPTDCRIHTGYGTNGESPGAYCFHNTCRPALDNLNRQFRNLIFGSGGNRPKPNKNDKKTVARSPRDTQPWIPAYDQAKLRAYTASAPEITPGYITARSPIDPRRLTSGQFLDAVFAPGQRILIFTDYYSPGDFGWSVGHGGCRLGAKRGIDPVPSALPTDGGTQGIWYLCQPIDGRWHTNPRNGKISRRSEESVTQWRHLLIESDEAPAGLWFKFLALLELQIKAIYSSGGKSWHALIALPEGITKPGLDHLLREKIKRILPVLGADPAAMTPVRLTRLPGCTRRGRPQQLIYLNPAPTGRILDLLPVREHRCPAGN